MQQKSESYGDICDQCHIKDCQAKKMSPWEAERLIMKWIFFILSLMLLTKCIFKFSVRLRLLMKASIYLNNYLKTLPTSTLAKHKNEHTTSDVLL